LADFRRGIEVGAIAGFAYIFVVGIIDAILGSYFSPGLVEVLSRLVWFMHWGSLHTVLLFVVQGIIFGAVFAALYTFLPGAGSVRKGLVLSVFLWIVALIQIIYGTRAYGAPLPIFYANYIRYGAMIDLSSIRISSGIISALIIGSLTGYLWGRFHGMELTEERKGKPVLLVSFILGGITWALVGARFLQIVGRSGWISAVTPSYWSGVLLILGVLLGFPGWILALIGWRRTKVGKSGLGWGVAGGVMMGVTGYMLLPGLLAIIGGVLSRRTPTTELAVTPTTQEQHADS